MSDLETYALAVADLIGEILPGGSEWPSGLEIGVQHAIQDRFVDIKGEGALPGLIAVLAEHGLPFNGEGAQARIAAVRALEEAEPALFGWFRDAAYLAYYESPAVIAVFNGRGTPLVARPHVTGYDMPRFDMVKDRPTHGRGSYIPTDKVARVDITGLELDSRITENWGLTR